MNFQAFYYVFHKIIKWGDILSRDAFLFLLACNKDKKCHPISCTGKSLSEALLFAEHGENMLCTKIVLNVRNNFCTQQVLSGPGLSL